GERKLASVSGQPIEFDGQACMLFTFADLEPRRKAQDALRQSEERFVKSFRLRPTPSIILSGQELHVLNANDAFLTSFGYTSKEVIGRSALQLGLLDRAAIHAQFRQALQE